MEDCKALFSQSLSRREIDFFAQQLAEEVLPMDEVLHLLDEKEGREAWHAAWILQCFFEKHPERLSSHILNLLTEKAIETEGESLRRLALNIIAGADFPDKLPVNLINSCFDWMLSAETSIAVKSASIRYLFKVCKHEPDLLPELKLCVQQLLETTDTGAIRSAAKKVLKG